MDGVICLPSVSDDCYVVDVVEVSVTSATNDPTGAIDSGFLRLRGVLKELHLKRNELLITDWVMTINGVEIRQGNGAGPRVALDVNQPELTGTKYCMLILAPPELPPSIGGLILETTGDATGQFRRIGVFYTSRQDLYLLILARHENESKLPCENFDAETQTHTICIV